MSSTFTRLVAGRSMDWRQCLGVTAVLAVLCLSAACLLSWTPARPARPVPPLVAPSTPGDDASLATRVEWLERRLGLMERRAMLVPPSVADLAACARMRDEGSNEAVLDSGGWCLTPAQVKKRREVLDEGLASGVASLFLDEGVSSVIDFGAGFGQVTRHLLAAGVPFATAVDGAPNVGEHTGGFVAYADLTQPQVFGAYDWVVSFECAEHIPPAAQAQFLDNVDRSNARGVVISWAPPGQPGVGHVNPLVKRDVVDIFAHLGPRGYALDEGATARLARGASMSHLGRNVLVFRKLGA